MISSLKSHLHMVNHEHFDWHLFRLQFESELRFDRSENIGERIRGRVGHGEVILCGKSGCIRHDGGFREDLRTLRQMAAFDRCLRHLSDSESCADRPLGSPACVIWAGPDSFGSFRGIGYLKERCFGALRLYVGPVVDPRGSG